MNSTVLITGATRGVGLGLAREAKSRGMTVLGTARDPAKAADLCSVADDVLPLDTGDARSIDALAASLGDRPLHMVINNAGVFPQRDLDALSGLDADAFEACMRVNVLGPLLVARALVENLRAGSPSTLAMVSSQLGSLQQVSDRVTKRWYAYCSSKAALNMSTILLRRELGEHGIECVAIHPGWVRTDMGGAEAALTPEASAKGILDTLANPPKDRGDRPLAWDGSVLPY